MAECEDEITDATTIDVMANDVETCVGFEKRVEDMERFTYLGGDVFCMEWSISARDRGVPFEKNPTEADVP